MGKTSAQQMMPPEYYTQLSAGVVAAPVTCPQDTRALEFGVGGTINCTMRNGTVVTGLPVQAGTKIGFFKSIEASTASNVWAVV